MKRAQAFDRSQAAPSGAAADKTRIIRASAPADRSKVTLELLPESGAFGQITLTPEGLLALIQSLGRIHTSMTQGSRVPAFEPGKMEAIINPRWEVSPALMGEATTFAFQHPGFGPLAFVVPLDQVDGMAKVLQNQVCQSQATKASPKN